MAKVKLISSDGEVFQTDVDIMSKSNVLQGMSISEEDDEPVTLPNVLGDTLKLVIAYCTFHKDDPPPPEDDENKEKRTVDICSWDQEFLNKVDQGTLFELILAANYLDIKGLLDVTCQQIANMIKGKTPQEIQKTFNIVPYSTPAEKEQGE